MPKEDKKVEKVLGKDPVLIEYTEKAQFHQKGEKVEVHKLVAEKLIKKGFATKAK